MPRCGVRKYLWSGLDPSAGEFCHYAAYRVKRPWRALRIDLQVRLQHPECRRAVLRESGQRRRGCERDCESWALPRMRHGSLQRRSTAGGNTPCDGPGSGRRLKPTQGWCNDLKGQSCLTVCLGQINRMAVEIIRLRRAWCSPVSMPSDALAAGGVRIASPSRKPIRGRGMTRA